jgi:hypothetical protein
VRGSSLLLLISVPLTVNMIEAGAESRIRAKMTRAVELATLTVLEAVDEALGVAAVAGRFNDGDLAAIPDYLAKFSSPTDGCPRRRGAFGSARDRRPRKVRRWSSPGPRQRRKHANIPIGKTFSSSPPEGTTRSRLEPRATSSAPGGTRQRREGRSATDRLDAASAYRPTWCQGWQQTLSHRTSTPARGAKVVAIRRLWASAGRLRGSTHRGRTQCVQQCGRTLAFLHL